MLHHADSTSRACCTVQRPHHVDTTPHAHISLLQTRHHQFLPYFHTVRSELRPPGRLCSLSRISSLTIPTFSAHWPLNSPYCAVLIAQSCPALCSTTDCSLPGSPAHGYSCASWRATPREAPLPPDPARDGQRPHTDGMWHSTVVCGQSLLRARQPHCQVRTSRTGVNHGANRLLTLPFRLNA